MSSPEKTNYTIADVWEINAFDPGWEAFIVDPFPFYDRLRRESPVHRIPSTGEYWLTRYQDVDFALKDSRFSAEQQFDIAAGNILGRSMVFRDPPDHTRLRTLVSKAFTPKMVQQIREKIEGVVERLVDGLRRKETIDLFEEFAYLLPMMVLGAVLGLPEEDAIKIGNWLTRRIVSTDLYNKQGGAAQTAGAAAYDQMLMYVTDKVKQRRADRGDDLISAMIDAEENSQRLTDDEIVAMVYLLIAAGHETSASGLANSVFHLLKNPSQLDQLRRRPELVPQAVEELLRYDSPAVRRVRRCTEDVRIGNTFLPKESLVTAVIAAANRDPEAFPEPNRIDLTRELPPHKSLAWGAGHHFCLGAFLARLEMQIALTRLLALPGFAFVEDDPPVWAPIAHFHRLSRLPLRMTWV